MTSPAASPSTRTARYAFAAGMIVDSVGTGLYLPFTLLFFHTVSGLSLASVGAGLSIAALVGVLATPLAGIGIDRFGSRPVLLASYAIRAVAFVGYLAAGNFAAFLAVAILATIGDKLFFPSNQGMIAEITEGKERDRLRALSRSIRNGGLGVGGLLAGLVIAGGGESGYVMIAVLNAASFALAGLLLLAVRGQRAEQAAKSSGGYRTVFADKPYLGLTSLNVLGGLAFAALSLAIPAYATGALGISASWIGILFGLNTALVAFGNVPLSRLVENARRTRVAALGAALFGGSFLLFPLAALIDNGRVALLVLAVTVYSIGEIFYSAGENGLAMDAAPAEIRGRYMAFHQLSYSVSGVLAPAAFTGLLSWNASVLWIGMGVALVAAATGFTALERKLPAAAVGLATPAPAPAVKKAPALAAA
ncbi:MFS transporter [Longispora albida]|uniref:MFS transporter n=1 Tax=Longispora albida TaxID=203523 RepID=UPI000380806D|nr:MFS transporter [Longispora albida]